MKEKMRLTTIWVSPDTYKKLLQVERSLVTKNDGTVNPDDAVRELVEFWKKHQL
jgi:hypothetical protein